MFPGDDIGGTTGVIDAPASTQGAADAPQQSPTGDGGSTSSPDTTGKATPGAQEPDGGDDYTQLRQSLENRRQQAERLSREKSTLFEELEATKQRLAELERGGSRSAIDRADDDGYEDAGKALNDPRLKGLKFDPDANRVEIDGQWETPRVAKAIVQAEAYENSQAESQKKQDQEDEQKRIETKRADMVEPIESAIAAECAKYGLPDKNGGKILTLSSAELLPVLTKTVMSAACLQAGIDFNDPDNIPETVQINGNDMPYADAVITLMDETNKAIMGLFGGLSAEQLRRNAESAKRHGARPGSAPTGVSAPKNIHQMSDSELNRHTADLVRDTENRQR